jgi:hypothetical protein
MARASLRAKRAMLPARPRRLGFSSLTASMTQLTRTLPRAQGPEAWAVKVALGLAAGLLLPSLGIARSFSRKGWRPGFYCHRSAPVAAVGPALPLLAGEQLSCGGFILSSCRDEDTLRGELRPPCGCSTFGCGRPLVGAPQGRERLCPSFGLWPQTARALGPCELKLAALRETRPASRTQLHRCCKTHSSLDLSSSSFAGLSELHMAAA